MDFRVLGPVEARAEGRPLPVAGARQRALLAVLLLRAGEPVSREGVIVDLWGERSPDGAPPLVARLQDLRAAAVEDRVEADLAMGRGAELVGELEGLLAAFASAGAAIACGVEHAAADRR